jgi:Domain of unknown function (DUF4189)
MFTKALTALTVVAVSCFATSVFADQHAAIAYSASTGQYGYSYGFSDLGDAETDAINRCGATDAVVVTWSRNEWCSLALSDDGSYGWGSGETQDESDANAMSACTGNPHIEVSVFSGTD